MGNNCPSGFTCEGNGIKACFKDKDGVKHGFCVTEANDLHVKKLVNGETMCPDCQDCPDCPACPDCQDCPAPGFQFFGQDLGNLDDQEAMKDFLNILKTKEQLDFCESQEFENEDSAAVEHWLKFGMIRNDWSHTEDLIDYTDSMTYTDFMAQAKANAAVSSHKADTSKHIEFMENHKSTFFNTNDKLSFTKVKKFLKNMYKLTCPSTPVTESYTGEFFKNNFLNFIVLLFLLTFVHLMINK